MASFGYRLKSLRESKNLTQEELADEIGVTKQAVSHYERGIRKPDFETLAALCDLFNVSTDFLLGKSDYTARLLDSDGLALVDSYYTNHETVEVAQEIFENRELRLLFDAARDITSEQLKMLHALALSWKK